jgi:hypothetical protein
MTRFIVALLAVLAGAASAAAQEQCSARCSGGFFEYLAKEYSENHQWPYPYYCLDRQAVRDPFAVMVQNGWRLQNLLADHHFQEKGSQLNDSGQAVVRRIVNDLAAQHRPIYVRRGQTADETAARMAAVQQFAAKIASDGDVPPILATNVSPAGYPAGWPPIREGAVSRKFQVWVPDKMYLPDQDKQGGGGGSK